MLICLRSKNNLKRGKAENLNSKLIIVIVENFESFVEFKNILFLNFVIHFTFYSILFKIREKSWKRNCGGVANSYKYPNPRGP